MEDLEDLRILRRSPIEGLQRHTLQSDGNAFHLLGCRIGGGRPGEQAELSLEFSPQAKGFYSGNLNEDVKDTAIAGLNAAVPQQEQQGTYTQVTDGPSTLASAREL
ncbi:hypothetical protein Neosp_003419 [[Neocosmospora] mangrovei]